ncbi:MAG TPA: citryl-CoA lyase [Terriglobales bacterium]|nr:citryl-CoA lyase [Terriglobales bacterium]
MDRQETWRTALVQADAESIRYRGYDIGALMRQAGFVDVVFLLHRGRMPSEGERGLLNAILVAVADHGSGAPSCAAARLVATGNRQSLSAAVAAGVLAVGDEHGGAGSLAMEMIAAGVRMAASEGIAVAAAADRAIAAARQEGKRLPGLGHRVHSVDPRVKVLFEMARQYGVAGDGVAFMVALEAAAGARIKPLPLNIDGALAAVLFDLGFPPEAGKLLFLVGRVAGLTAEVAEEYGREKPMRIRFPVVYDGEPPRSLE